MVLFFKNYNKMFPILPMDELRYICAKHWNPIGTPMKVNLYGNPPKEGLPADEYDAYLEHVWILVAFRKSRDEILKYLEWVERDYIMLSEPAGDKFEFVRALFKLRKKYRFSLWIRLMM